MIAARSLTVAVTCLVATMVLGGCQSGLDDKAPLPSLDEAYFRCKVQPILTKNCSMFACHGTPERAFRLYARNRLRFGIADKAQVGSFLTDDERKLNFEAARAFVDTSSKDLSWLLKKPLEADAGGYYHGATKLGTSNVFENEKNAEYQVLVKWVNGEKGDPTCIEDGSDQ